MSTIESLPGPILLLPFISLLLMLATGPVFYPRFWHQHYPKVAIGLAAIVISYYVLWLHELASPLHAFVDYIQFILLIGALYMASGTILIKVNRPPSVYTNLAMLWGGALIANIIGTTGASMVLIRPYIRLNRQRLAPYHIVFFIFMVSNIGGVLTPIGDPPLFLGFLKGVPFFWTLVHGWSTWLLALVLIGLLFYFFDSKVGRGGLKPTRPAAGKQWEIRGIKHLLLFPIIIGAVFLDPNREGSAIPSITCHGIEISYLRELILFFVILTAYKTADRRILAENNFSLAPLKEVFFVFIGIFGTMPPALLWIKFLAQQHSHAINPHSLFWITGILSSMLDNAPVYLNMLTAGMQAQGLDIASASNVLTYGEVYSASLQATSIGAVFFGAMTYIGNGPNFMVRAIAEEEGVNMPSFGQYIVYYGIPLLLPVLSLTWLFLSRGW